MNERVDVFAEVSFSVDSQHTTGANCDVVTTWAGKTEN